MEVKVIFKGYLRDIVGCDKVILHFKEKDHVNIINVVEELMRRFSILQHEFNAVKEYWNNPFLILIQRKTEIIQASLNENVIDGDNILIIPIAVGG